VLLGPVAARLEGRRDLLVSPDGALHRLPLKILQEPDGRYLVEPFRVAYLPSGRDLLRRGEGQPLAGAAAVILADPDFDAGGESTRASLAPSAPAIDAVRDLAGRRFAPLPETRGEGEAVAAILRDHMELTVRLETGPAAREEALWSMGRPSVVHLATHGFFLGGASGHDDPPAAIDLEPLREGLPESEPRSPLRRSGIALAGANASLRRGGDEGLVTAEKPVGLELRGADLVVLSACETALGEVQPNEGVFGLERAFLLAGARTLVLSLWPVSDEATRYLMTTFYAGWAQGWSKAEALRRARLELRRRSAHPADWGAFILVGDPGELPLYPAGPS
jgi:CHAT domain-containing protein